jgi:hypothetical protein
MMNNMKTPPTIPLVIAPNTEDAREVEPIIEVVPHSGALIVSDMIGNHRFSHTYYGYTKEDAILAFYAEYYSLYPVE